METFCRDCIWLDRQEALGKGMPKGLAPCRGLPPQSRTTADGTMQMGYPPSHEDMKSCSLFTPKNQSKVS